MSQGSQNKVYVSGVGVIIHSIPFTTKNVSGSIMNYGSLLMGKCGCREG